MKTESSTVSLVPFSTAHVEKTYGWISNPELRRVFLMRGEPNYQTHLAYFQQVLSDPSQRVYAILMNDKHIGNCGLKHIAKERSQTELWIYIGENAFRGQGIGFRANKQLLDIAFGELRLNRVYLHVADFNSVAIRQYERLGFREVPLSSEVVDWTDRGCQILEMELLRISS